MDSWAIEIPESQVLNIRKILDAVPEQKICEMQLAGNKMLENSRTVEGTMNALVKSLLTT